MKRKQVREILCQVIQQEPNIAYDSTRCRGVLLDRLQGWCNSEISHLVSGIEKGLVGQILDRASNSNCDRLETDLIQLLQSRSDMKSEDARWVVCSWLEAVNHLNQMRSPVVVGAISPENPEQILVRQELLDLVTHIETDPDCIEIVEAAQRGKKQIGDSRTPKTIIFTSLKSLFFAQPHDFYGRAYVNSEFKKDAKITAKIVTWSNLLDFVTNYPIIFFLFSEMGILPAFVLSSLLNTGLLKLTNDLATSVSRQRSHLKWWSRSSLLILIGINGLQSLVSGVGMELMKNQSQLQQDLATEVIEQKISSIEQLKQQNSLEYQATKSSCQQEEKRLEQLAPEHHLRDSLYTKIYGSFADQQRGWQGISLEKLPLCVKAEKLREKQDSNYNKAFLAMQSKLDIRYETSNDLIFLKDNFPEIYQQYFTETGEIISGIEMVRLAWDSFFAKLANREFSALGLSFYLFIISWLTSLGAILMTLSLNHSRHTQVSLSDDVIYAMNSWFDELFNNGQ